MTVVIENPLHQALLLLLEQEGCTTEKLAGLVNEPKETIVAALEELERMGCITQEQGKWRTTQLGESAQFEGTPEVEDDPEEG